MTRMILHAKLTLNHFHHSIQRPQVGGITCCLCALQKNLLQFLFLLWSQSWGTPWMGLGFERFHASLLKILFPSRNRRGRSPCQIAHFSNSLAVQEQTPSHKPTNFQCFCATFRSHNEYYYINGFVPIKIRRSIVPFQICFD